eukprot:TRINITY_DN74708_c0_g1_i1.p1 TRINITY_DN74708_c0_g1~~TRINITY_DN74708_c0_g1_i1.p1  ORF type:complete len:171 (+),score=34.12 TRINITY_DN74708_c0_g1_i1:86-598(+)
MCVPRRELVAVLLLSSSLLGSCSSAAGGSPSLLAALSRRDVARTPQLFLEGEVTPATEEEAMEMARRTLEDILARAQASQAQDVTKKEYCRTHAIELEQKLADARTQWSRDLAELERLNSELRDCGMFCDNNARLRVQKGYARDDVAYQEGRISNIEEQITHLGNWCSVL